MIRCNSGYGDATCVGERVAGTVGARGGVSIVTPTVGSFCDRLQGNFCEFCLFIFVLFCFKKLVVTISSVAAGQWRRPPRHGPGRTARASAHSHSRGKRITSADDQRCQGRFAGLIVSVGMFRRVLQYGCGKILYTLAHGLAPQNPSNTGLLRQLNVWFPGEFRAIVDPPLYARADTTVVQATHKVSLNALIGWRLCVHTYLKT